MPDDLVLKAFQLMYPERNASSYRFSLTYSGRFKEYRSKVKYRREQMDFFLSDSWKGVNENILIGLLHELFIKIFNTKNPNTLFYIDLYNAFIKNVHIAIPKTKSDPDLEESFDRVNERYFNGFADKPNLVWGQYSRRKLGSYDFHSDTISMSRMLENKNQMLLDYVMYHEVLHKQLKFSSKNGKMRYHGKKFRMKEKEFEDSALAERLLKTI